MVSLLPTAPASRRTPGRSASRADARRRRPLALVTVLGGVVAASITLAACLTAGMVGWFLSDAGAHGAPRDGLRVGALGWLMAHGSGVLVDGVRITAVPLLLTLLCAVTVWRVAHRVGDAVSGHGPDADRLADGERDWTVATASLGFGAGYLAVVVAVSSLASTAATRPSTASALLWALGLVALIGVPALAVGTGRAAIWTAPLPATWTLGAITAWRILRAFWLASAALLLGALLVDGATAVNIVSQLQLNTSGTVAYVLVTLLVLPNAVLFGGAYLLGPGFSVGAGTLVSPAGVVLGALPLFPLLAALPDTGPVPAWTPWLIALPPLVAAYAVARVQRRHPTFRWEEGALRGCGAGVVAGVLLGLLTALAGGAVGPGRMQVVAPYAFDVLLHAIASFGLGGLAAGLAMTWWQRRTLLPVDADAD